MSFITQRSCLLAAGRGRRAGGPKAWLVHDGRTLLETQLAFLLRHFEPSGIAVSIQEDWLTRCLAIHSGVRWVPVDPDAPALASLQALLRAGPPRSWAFLHHVDMPVWEDALFAALSRAAEESPEVEALIPTRGGRGGHPILLSRSVVAAVTALDPLQDRLDHWLQGRKALRLELPFDCILENWNSQPHP